MKSEFVSGVFWDITTAGSHPLCSSPTVMLEENGVGAPPAKVDTWNVDPFAFTT